MPTNNSFNTAQDLGLLNGSIVPVTGFVGTSDREDYFRFTLTQNTNVTFDLTGLSEAAQLELTADLNNNGVFSNGETIETDAVNDFSSSTVDRGITRILTPGAYWARVFTSRDSENTSYTLAATATPVATLPSDPGSSYSTALNIGNLGAQQVFSDAVGSLDRSDYYQFTLPQNGQVTLNITGLSEAAQIGLIADLNGNGVFDNGEIVEADDVNDFSSSIQDRGIGKTIAAGTYWAAVFNQRETENTAYTFRASAVSVPTLGPDPGDDFDTALNIGNLGSQQTFSDVVGSLDQVDFYQFNLTEDTTVTFNLSGLSEAAQLALYADLNGNGIFDNGERIEDDGVNDFSSSTQDRGIIRDLGAGTYYAAVFTAGTDDNTGYTLTASSGIEDGVVVPPGFDPDDYLASNPDLIFAFGYNLQAATDHYLNFGQFEGRPIDTFLEGQYLASFGDLQAAFGNDLVAATRHYIESGFFEGRDPLVGFDGAAYIASYDDLINAFGFSPDAGREHFRQSGLLEGRTITFDPREYLASYGDLIQAFGLNLDAAAQHFITNGQAEGRSRDAFSGEAYLSVNLDVAAVLGGDLGAAAEHYILFGFAEGRAVG